MFCSFFLDSQVPDFQRTLYSLFNEIDEIAYHPLIDMLRRLGPNHRVNANRNRGQDTRQNEEQVEFLKLNKILA